MKKKLFIFTASVILAVCLLAGCGSSSSTGNRNNARNNVVDVIQDQMDQADGKTDSSDDNSGSSSSKKNEADPDVDVDLTAMSSTMVYSEVSNMMYDPEQYKGKTVKMGGQYNEYYDETAGRYYYSCIIKDATACCAQGIEFELTDDYVFPRDYPADQDDVTVIGTFDTYVEDNFLFCTLRNARLVS